MILRIVAFLLMGICLVVPTSAQVYEGVQLVQASLLSDKTAVVPGESFRVGVLLEIAPGWHTYWEYAGDSGLPTQLKWKLPQGWQVGPVEWPLPERLVEPGDLVVYAYKSQVLLMATIFVPADYSAPEAEIQVVPSWLVCGEICVPGDAKLAMTLPIASSAEPMNQELFNRFVSLLPSDTPVPYELEWQYQEGAWMLSVSGLPKEVSIDFYPLPTANQVVGHVAQPMPGQPRGAGDKQMGRGISLVAKSESEKAGLPLQIDIQPEVMTLRIPTKGEIEGVLVVESQRGERKGFVIKSPTAESSTDSELEKLPAAASWVPTLLVALFYGFLGGLILNLMPCVLPVISLKIFGFIQQAGHDRRRIFVHGMAFIAGIFLWFFGLALAVVLLRAGGAQVNWAFQFQNPWFMLFISAVVFVFALNLFGVFEVILSGKASMEMAQLGEKQGYAGSFFQGVFATLLATPCTAPFLGTALGFAFSQPAGVIFAMFGAVALGMASPYFLLSARPGWMRFLPRPGGWMERVKQLMGFPLLITLVWLLSIIGGQKGVGGMVWAASILLCVAFACWLYGAFICGGKTVRARWIAGLLAMASMVGGGYYFGNKFSSASASMTGMAISKSGIPWQPYSKALLDHLLSEGKPVFVDFTADWCLTCKFNEATAIDTPAVRQIIAEKGIVPLRADWTNQNPEIAEELRKYGRVGVPFYLVFPGEQHAVPIQLPELLTEQIVLDAFKMVE